MEYIKNRKDKVKKVVNEIKNSRVQLQTNKTGQ